MTSLIRLSEYKRKKAPRVHFTKNELNQLINLYSRRVIVGEWKDYAIDHGRGMSAFSVYRDSSGLAAYTIYKFAGGSNKNGNFAVGSGGTLIKRGKTLTEALAVLERQLTVISPRKN